jgi:flagellar basal body-associated protein FliL
MCRSKKSSKNRKMKGSRTLLIIILIMVILSIIIQLVMAAELKKAGLAAQSQIDTFIDGLPNWLNIG